MTTAEPTRWLGLVQPPLFLAVERFFRIADFLDHLIRHDSQLLCCDNANRQHVMIDRKPYLLVAVTLLFQLLCKHNGLKLAHWRIKGFLAYRVTCWFEA